MKILFLLTQDLESPAGVGRYFPWARELAALGHQVGIAALHANYASLTTTRYVDHGVDVHYVAQMHVLKQGNQKIYFQPAKLIKIASIATLELVKAAWGSQADIIQIGKPHPMNGIAGLVEYYLKNKIVFLDCDDFEMENIHFSGGWQKIGVRFFESVLPRAFDFDSVHTTFFRDYLIQRGVSSKKIIYLPNGVDESRFRQVNNAEVEKIRAQLGLHGKKVIVYVGSLSMPSHPVDLLIDAFQEVHNINPEVVLLIVGGGEEYIRLVERVKKLGLERAVVFCGKIRGADVPLYYKVADVSAEPVMNNTVGKSILPLKMFESWISGIPFVTHDVGDRKMALGDPPAGMLAEGGNSHSLANAIRSVLDDPELADALRTRGYEQAKKYSWKNLVKQMETVYFNAIAAKHNRAH